MLRIGPQWLKILRHTAQAYYRQQSPRILRTRRWKLNRNPKR